MTASASPLGDDDAPAAYFVNEDGDLDVGVSSYKHPRKSVARLLVPLVKTHLYETDKMAQESG